MERFLPARPTLATFETLSKNIGINGQRNILAFHCALSNNNEQIRLYQYADSSRSQEAPLGIEVKMMMRRTSSKSRPEPSILSHQSFRLNNWI